MNLYCTYTNYVKNFTYLGGRIRHDNAGRGHSHAYSIYLTNRRPRTNAAPKKGIRLLLDEYKQKNLRRLGNLHYSDNFNSILAKKSMKLEL